MHVSLLAREVSPVLLSDIFCMCYVGPDFPLLQPFVKNSAPLKKSAPTTILSKAPLIALMLPHWT